MIDYGSSPWNRERGCCVRYRARLPSPLFILFDPTWGGFLLHFACCSKRVSGKFFSSFYLLLDFVVVFFLLIFFSVFAAADFDNYLNRSYKTSNETQRQLFFLLLALFFSKNLPRTFPELYFSSTRSTGDFVWKRACTQMATTHTLESCAHIHISYYANVFIVVR